MPNNHPEVEELLRDFDNLISKYSQSTDPRVVKAIRRFKRARDKISASEAVDKVFKLLVIADKLQEWFDRLP